MAKPTTKPDAAPAATTVTHLVERFFAARRAATPIVWVGTPDAAATVAAIATAIAERQKEPAPMVVWDCVRGVQPLNAAAQAFARAIGGSDRTSFVDAVSTFGAPPPADGQTAAGLPSRGIAFMLNAHLALVENGATVPQAVQAAWNCRDTFKLDRRTLVLVAPHVTVPAELRHDVIVLDEPLPNGETLAAIVREQFTAARLAEPSQDDVDRAVDRLTGLAAFPAEQVTAMSLTGDGLNLDSLVDEQARVINSTPGLAVHRPDDGDRVDLMRGCDNVIEFADRLFHGARAPRGIVWIDEIEKGFAGLAGDTSGTTQDQLATFLHEVQEMNADGVMLVGHPGTGKSMLPKALAHRYRRPLIRFDLGAAKHGIVGSSEARVRDAFKTIRAVTGGQCLIVATSNGLGVLPPELRRRFKLGTFMFELPGPAEVAALLVTYSEFHGVPAARRAKSPAAFADWTGAEIATACGLAARLACTVDEAAEYVVPVARSMPERITVLRNEAHARYLDARKRGAYRAPGAASQAPVVMPLARGGRLIGGES